jgi:hypothetical protein
MNKLFQGTVTWKDMRGEKEIQKQENRKLAKINK